MSRKLRSASLALIAAVFAVPAPAFADVVHDPYPIGPGQDFVGLVNGQPADATIAMACFGPTWPGRTGHPMDGQTLSAQRVFTSAKPLVGNTGEAGRAIDVVFRTSGPLDQPVLLKAYGITVKIPTTLTLPCDGSSTVWFVPIPAGPSARPAAVPVTFASQP